MHGMLRPAPKAITIPGSQNPGVRKERGKEGGMVREREREELEGIISIENVI